MRKKMVMRTLLLAAVESAHRKLGNALTGLSDTCLEQRKGGRR
jgi:hypothetical protein